ncbi:cytochrome P450 [Biscogniauxia mediterranea]|nr:cytochrome P450 [Biscogniauxia mediterranea]
MTSPLEPHALPFNPPSYATLGIAITAFLLVLVYRLALPKPIPGIPYDAAAARSILGSMPQMNAFRKVNDNRLLLWFAKQAETNRWPISQFWFPFSKPSIILADYREVQDILLRRTKEFGRDHRTRDLFANTTPEFHVALLSEDPKYKINKSLVKDIMSPTFLQNVSSQQVYRKCTFLIDLWRFKLEAAKGIAFDASEDIFSALSDTITGAAYALNDDMSTVRQRSQYLRSFDGNIPLRIDEHGAVEFPDLPPLPYYEAFRILSDHQGDQQRAGFPALAHHFEMLTQPQLRWAYKTVHDFEAREIQKSIARVEADANNLTSALDYIVMRELQIATNEGRKPNFYQRRIFDEMSGYYMAGHETSATTVSWAVKFIAQHAEVQEKLRLALRTSFPAAVQENRQPTVTEIMKANVPYLMAVIDETLRMRPPFGIIAREALVDTVLLGHKIPKGTTIMMPSFGPSLHSPALPIPEEVRSESSRTKQWGHDWAPEDIHLFKPERWLKVDEEKAEVVHDPQAGPMQSFGLGPRQCFGKRLAYVQLRAFITLLVWNFKFHNVEGRWGLNDVAELVTSRPKYCYVKLEAV